MNEIIAPYLDVGTGLAPGASAECSVGGWGPAADQGCMLESGGRGPGRGGQGSPAAGGPVGRVGRSLTSWTLLGGPQHPRVQKVASVSGLNLGTGVRRSRNYFKNCHRNQIEE